MARRRKMYRFEQNKEAYNVIERGKPLYTTIKGHWLTDYFKNDNPIVVELGCGRGEYTVGLATAYPDRNFIGVDIKGDRIARGSQAALEAGLSNVAFLRTDVNYLLEFFDEEEVDEVWITFPDPQPRDKQEKHRLTYSSFLTLYRSILKNEGVLHLKTDHAPFFEYSLQSLPDNGFTIVASTTDLYQSPLNDIHLGIKTKYEAMFYAKGFSINYLQSRKGDQ
ncbi:tRNA (guanosine(46)-N7)-methyltransferase TrmB [Fibrivirga algicola]|uniref:tRNA (guanine-N(7)-)-methyltransferase n=1 Tax=Fibrivirga algicola TaxID=2950420 RepID=A0ABX0QNJ3_9BACT|nr:tRNA (guanosine(46)-N7)-methyltransferase TrmB [Fibrivirga algicola]NID12437.1 tRNA (guanosine(46)-N7)-methyltransferase TrmB [Fibrivirga algicola]